METDYWRKAQVKIQDYPEVADDSTDFPHSIHIAFAVCRKSCGSQQFIVDGGTQICEKCGKMMFRTESKAYTIAQNQEASE